MKLKQRLSLIFFSDLIGLTWAMGWLGAVLSMGFFFSSSMNSNYTMLIETFPKEFWGSAFLLYGVTQLTICLFLSPHYIRAVNSFVGVWIWLFVFVSFNIYDKAPVNSTEWLLGMPVLTEAWLFSTAMMKQKIVNGLKKENEQLLSTIGDLSGQIGFLNDSLCIIFKENAEIRKEVVNLSTEVMRLKEQLYTPKVS